MIKKSLLAIGVLIVVATAAVLLFAAAKPDSFRIERKIAIKAPPEKIFALVGDLPSHRKWSPWETKDPKMKRTYSGPPHGVGARYEWDGNSEVGKGRMTITELAPPAKVIFDLYFIGPFEVRNAGSFVLTPDGDTTTVTWALYGPSPFISKVMDVLCNMDKMVGREFDTGLATLKALAEK